MQTRTVKTPSGKNAEIREFLNTRERNELRGVFIKHSTFTVEAGMTKVERIDGQVTDEAEAKLISLAVISYDGSQENILGRLLDGNPQDYDFLIAEAGKAVGGNLMKAK